MAQYTGREWVFTINAKDCLIEEECHKQLNPIYEHLKEMIEPPIEYLVVKGERGANGNYHLQGYVMFASTITRNRVKEAFGCNWMYLEKRAKGSSPSLAAAYVKKTETSWDGFPILERGEVPKGSTAPAEMSPAQMRQNRTRMEVAAMMRRANIDPEWPNAEEMYENHILAEWREMMRRGNC